MIQQAEAEKRTPCETGVTATKDILELHPKLDLGGRGPRHWYQWHPSPSVIGLPLLIAVQPSERRAMYPPEARAFLGRRQ